MQEIDCNLFNEFSKLLQVMNVTCGRNKAKKLMADRDIIFDERGIGAWKL